MNDFCSMISKQNFKILRKNEVAKLLGVSCSTLYRMVRSGRFPEPHRSPKGYIQGWTVEALEQWRTNPQS
ncbi:helix-turn-helix domain-containing protein [Vibrio alginolyticus]|nr:helix-turn-helix domain-containing protein [Vibrio alginolyticus]KLE24167.1 hypothetical protein AAW52_13365 [Vibrio diabolicus]EGQ8983204.1 helix-turn-helix domain-containing protein [Vibrio alginolyticus]EJL6781874.1 helix-turn-helix domain-containing protein [Vibrio alginolyticus]EKM3678717.1 helix-turn-helix domain-containing protein [Vibrio alginolyticus]